jgi:hypothetical protein
MNPEAVAWLEGLDGYDHTFMFKPPAGEPGQLFGLKDDHESCGFCPNALRRGELEVIG